MNATLSRALAALGDEVLDSHEELGDPTLLIRRESALDSLRRLRDDDELEMNFLMDLCAVDYLGREPRFEVVYHLASIDTQPRGGEPSPLRARLRVKAQVGVEEPEIASAVPVWGAANWMEREVYDLYGIRFSGHPDLRRILLYDAFRGHPLRKDYPKRRRQPLVGPRDA